MLWELGKILEFIDFSFQVILMKVTNTGSSAAAAAAASEPPYRDHPAGMTASFLPPPMLEHLHHNQQQQHGAAAKSSSNNGPQSQQQLSTADSITAGNLQLNHGFEVRLKRWFYIHWKIIYTQKNLSDVRLVLQCNNLNFMHAESGRDSSMLAASSRQPPEFNNNSSEDSARGRAGGRGN